MGKISLSISPLSPLLMAGADPKKPELRAASFRGSFRYWLRAVVGDGHDNMASLARLARRESKYFGSTRSELDENGNLTGWNSGSPLRLRVVGEMAYTGEARDTVLPPRLSYSYAEPMGIELHFYTHPIRSLGKLCDDRFWAMLLLAFNFSGFGKRSRRGGGIMQVEHINLEDVALTPKAERGLELLQEHPNTRENLIAYLQTVAGYISDELDPPFAPEILRPAPPALPAYSIFHPNHVQVFLSKVGSDHFLKSMVDAFWEPTGSFHKTRGVWGQINTRRSSALHVCIHRVGEELYTLVTIFHSAPGAAPEWAGLRRVASALNRSCDLIYGTPGGW